MKNNPPLTWKAFLRLQIDGRRVIGNSENQRIIPFEFEYKTNNFESKFGSRLTS